MKCSKHPDREAAGICTYSGKPFCSEELIEIEGKMYGKDYVSKILENSKSDSNSTTEENFTTPKWYDNKAIVGLLIVVFFPVGLYALWKSNTISKGWKVGWSIIILVVGVYALGSKEPIDLETSTTTTSQLGITYDQMMESLSDNFDMEKAEPVNGEDRYMGISSNGIAVIEIIGKKENITKATISIGLPSDNTDAVVENSALFQRFLSNIATDWDESSNWATSTLTNLVETSISEKEKVYNGRRYKITYHESMGMLLLTIEAE